MSKVISEINDSLKIWMETQKIFFVATAPLSKDGHINCSPKGGETFRVLNPHMVAYQDLTGSGVETIAHLKNNGRIVIMFCAFEGVPKIVRLHGRGEVISPNHVHFAELCSLFAPNAGTRAIIRIKVSRISDSCGMAVPCYQFKEERKLLDDWANRKGPEGLRDYRRQKNLNSIDGLTGVSE